ncbi:MAG: DUF4132 domain-containing protein [Oceanobacter sp.]
MATMEKNSCVSNSQDTNLAIPDNFRDLYQCWQDTAPGARVRLFSNMFALLHDCAPEDQASIYELLDAMQADAPNGFVKRLKSLPNRSAALYVERNGSHDARNTLLLTIVEIRDKILEDQTDLARYSASDTGYIQASLKGAIRRRQDSLRGYSSILNNLARTLPHTARSFTPRQFLSIAPFLKPDTLVALLPHLTINRKSTSQQQLRKFWVRIAPKLPLSAFQAAGWFEKPTKSLRRLGLEVLLVHPDPAATERLQSLYPEPADWMNSHDISRLDDCLLDTAGNSLSLEELERRAARITQMDDDVKRMLTTPLLEITHPLSEHATGVLLQLIKEAKSEPLSPLAIKLKNQLDSNKHLNLNRYLLESWIALNGNYQLRWTLSQLLTTRHNSLVDVLFATIKRWHKPHWQETMFALEKMASFGTAYALMQVQAITEIRGIRKSIAERANGILQATAETQGISLSELRDQLTPDFGLSKGLTMKVGSQSFAVELQGDLTLRVRNAQEKLTKSIPKPKDNTLLTEWEQSKAQWKELNKNLKTVIKRQQPRMYAAFITGSKWSASRWQNLFLQSPLFRAMGQSLIWADNKGHSFRISEDGSLVRSDDEPYSLARNGQVSLWHPANTTPKARQEWQDYFADYEITPMIDQLNATAQLPTIPPDHPTGQIPIPDGVKVDCRALITLLKKLGYRSGARQHRGDTHDHYWSLAPEGLIIKLHHAPISILYQEYYLHDRDKEYRSITLEHLTVSKETRDINEPVNIHSLPKALQATLQSHIEQLIAIQEPQV